MLTWRPIPNAEELTVDHLNHNKRDNSLENLEWVTKEENLRRAAEDLIKKDKKKNSTNESPQDIIEKEKQRAITKAIENFNIYNAPIKDNTNCVLGLPQKYSSCMAAAEIMLKDDKYKDIHNLSQETIAKRIRKGMKPEQTKQDYKVLKTIYKALPKTIKNKLGKLQGEAKRRKGKQ